MDKNLLFGRLIPPFAWGYPPNASSFLCKGLPSIGHCSIAAVLCHLGRALAWGTELPGGPRAQQPSLPSCIGSQFF